jgi:proline iminopeptidase
MMRKVNMPRISRVLCACAGLAATTCPALAQDADQPRELFPVRQPFKTGYLPVGGPHEIFYALAGNPDGNPVIVLHGGPGFGCYPRLMQYFNPDKFLIVLHDQRGAGRSRPPGELRDNTTQHLIADIERLRNHLGIKGKALVFGGSWGSTLGLAYAETHPDHVSGMVLRGIFAGTRKDWENVFACRNARLFFPKELAALEASLPPGVDAFTPRALLKVFTSDDKKTARRVADAWARYAIKIGRLHASDESVAKGFGDWDPLPACRIDCQYASNTFFLAEGQLLRDADRLKDVPVTIINGRYDMICPPITAYELHKRLPKSKLIIVEEAGHSEGEPGTTQALLEAVAAFE